MPSQYDDKEFLTDLNQLIAKTKIDVMNEVIQAGHEIRNEALKRTPVDTGALRSAWKVRTDHKLSGGGTVEISNETKYAAAIEYGTRPHTIRAVNKKGLADKKRNKFFGKIVHHPGTKAQPMLRPALNKILPKLTARLKGL